MLEVNECKVRFQIDTGAQVNTICQRYVRREQLYPTTKNLIMWNKTNIKPVGETVLNVINPKSTIVHATNLIVVKNDFNCLLRLSTIQEFNLITVDDNCFIANLDTTSDLDDLGTVNLKINKDVRPKILPSCKIPLPLQSKVKQELDNLVKRNVISFVNEPTERVRQMAHYSRYVITRTPTRKWRL